MSDLQLILVAVVSDEDLLQLMVDALHAAGHPGDGGLGHRDAGQRHLGWLRHGRVLLGQCNRDPRSHCIRDAWFHTHITGIIDRDTDAK